MSEETTQPVAPQLGMQDLAIAIQAIDLAAKAGAFSGNDLEVIGGARNRIATFVKANMPPPAEAASEEQTETESADAE